MSSDDDLKKILDRFFSTASKEEIEELYRLLEKREKFRGPDMKVDVQNLARNMSKQIQEQMGLSNLNIKKMARELVVSMARQYKPRISEKELNALVKSMVPDSEKRASEKIPPDIMKTMIVHFIAYSSGKMNAMEKKKFPAGWEKKYWSAFPPAVRELILCYLKGEINSRTFWSSIDISLTGRK